jgi:hypothetical protein
MSAPKQERASVEPKVAKEVAQDEIARWMSSMCLRFDTESMDAEDRTGHENSLETLTNAVMDGNLVLNEKSEFVYSPLNSEGGDIIFHEPTGASLMAMDQHKKNHDVGKGFATMCEMTRQNMQRYSKMGMRDLRVCQTLTMLFLRST